jgi:hypothetical protein
VRAANAPAGLAAAPTRARRFAARAVLLRPASHRRTRVRTHSRIAPAVLFCGCVWSNYKKYRDKRSNRAGFQPVPVDTEEEAVRGRRAAYTAACAEVAGGRGGSRWPGPQSALEAAAARAELADMAELDGRPQQPQRAGGFERL